MVEIAKSNEFENPEKVSEARTSSTSSTTPLFWVIKDPRESRRQRLLELRKKLSNNNDLKVQTPKPFVVQTTSPSLSKTNPSKIDSKFELPKIRDRLVTFSLTNGAKINQYKWIGIYDQCLKVKFYFNTFYKYGR